jgi:catechol 2,3-dioxygenase-like lactoylglutathione lyase family enzyme
VKRLHVHVGVADLDASVRFYTNLFGAGPTVAKPDYAKWMLDDPRMNFAVSSGAHTAPGVEHLGIQVESDAELGEVYGRLQAAERPVLEEGRTTCCYAQSEKSWIADPDGLLWEAFLTSGEASAYGAGVRLDALGESGAGCCTPAAQASGCCA